MIDDLSCFIVQTTLKERSQAVEMASALIEASLLGCAHVIGPITSVYRWEARTEIEQEYLLIGKTTEELLPVVEDRIKQTHPYELPEIIAMRLHSTSKQYGQWIRQQCAQ